MRWRKEERMEKIKGEAEKERTHRKKWNKGRGGIQMEEIKKVDRRVEQLEEGNKRDS